jgi:uncharacterized membrane protein YeiH
VDGFGPETVTGILDVTGILIGAMLGASVAVRERFDITGTVALAIVSGTGGGMIRDTLLSVGPPLALLRPSYLVAAILGATVVLVVDVPKWKHARFALLTGDALLIGFFAAAGCQRAALQGLEPISVALLGIVTAIGGGLIRDVLVGQQPAVLRGGPLYATVAIIAAATFAVMDGFGAPQNLTTLVCLLVGFGLRMAAIIFGIETSAEPEPLGPKRMLERLRRGKRRVGVFTGNLRNHKGDDDER